MQSEIFREDSNLIKGDFFDSLNQAPGNVLTMRPGYYSTPELYKDGTYKVTGGLEVYGTNTLDIPRINSNFSAPEALQKVLLDLFKQNRNNLGFGAVKTLALTSHGKLTDDALGSIGTFLLKHLDRLPEKNAPGVHWPFVLIYRDKSNELPALSNLSNIIGVATGGTFDKVVSRLAERGCLVVSAGNPFPINMLTSGSSRAKGIAHRSCKEEEVTKTVTDWAKSQTTMSLLNRLVESNKVDGPEA